MGEKIATIQETKGFMVLVDRWQKFFMGKVYFFVGKHSKPARGRKQIKKIFWQLWGFHTFSVIF